MEISAVIRRGDLVALNFYLFPRLRANWIFFALLAAGIFTVILITREPSNALAVGVAIMAALVGALAGSIVGMLVGLITMLSMLGKNSGVLGVHHYTLSTVGLGERTDANESLLKWSGIHSITKLQNYLFFRINGYLFHIVPRRSFHTTEAFNSFYERAVEYRRNVTPQ